VLGRGLIGAVTCNLVDAGGWLDGAGRMNLLEDMDDPALFGPQ
jgi:hypothetical protein